jgi:hypothetical protein
VVQVSGVGVHGVVAVMTPVAPHPER